jgi:hypothetical protein
MHPSFTAGPKLFGLCSPGCKIIALPCFIRIPALAKHRCCKPGWPRGCWLTANHVFTASGVYTVTLTITDDDGGIGQDTLQVIIKPGGYFIYLPVLIKPAGN